MADLSPQAQAVVNAFLAEWHDCFLEQDRCCIAAAIRAAANQVVPEFAHDDDDIYGETMQDVRRKLLAIATELEGTAND